MANQQAVESCQARLCFTLDDLEKIGITSAGLDEFLGLGGYMPSEVDLYWVLLYAGLENPFLVKSVLNAIGRPITSRVIQQVAFPHKAHRIETRSSLLSQAGFQVDNDVAQRIAKSCATILRSIISASPHSLDDLRDYRFGIASFYGATIANKVFSSLESSVPCLASVDGTIMPLSVPSASQRNPADVVSLAGR